MIDAMNINVDGVPMEQCPFCHRAMDKVGGAFPYHTSEPGLNKTKCDGSFYRPETNLRIHIKD